MSQPEKTWEEREVGALWHYTDKTPHYKGHFVDKNGKKQRVIIFKNKKKTGNQPDLRIYSDE